MSDPFLVSPATAARSDSPSLVDLVDRVLDRGCVIEGELWLTVADVDLVYLGLKAVLTTPERFSRSEG
ncbi:gas vesicle protein [Yangia mangrovi]|uniref:Gas vesicle protein n=1 Tax=Alloyangia mangrovi TaxID=1779329 RepID=A0ABT2KRG0_9RHOB|nr:gas vesicle protein [Alloyangia mangrovi]MCT4373414.1 gas vesicle protein [Alloyangia mangrovi]